MGKIIENVNHSRGRVVKLDYDFIRAQSTDKCLFCLNRQQIAALLPQLELIRPSARWYSLIGTTIDYDWLDAFTAEIEAELMTDHCDLATSITDILTQITTINTSITTINANLTVINEAVNIDLKVVNNYTDNYQINIIFNQAQNPSPALPDKTFITKTTDTRPDQRYARWAALVLACKRYLKSLCYRMLNIDDPSNTSIEGAWENLALAGGLMLGVVGTVPLASVGTTFNDLLAAMEDDTAISDVACVLANALAPHEITFTNWYNACLVGSFTSGTDQYLLQAVLAAAAGVDVTFQYNYQGFVNTLADEWAYVLAKNENLTGLTYEGCTLNVVLPWDADFTQGQFNGWKIRYGVYVPGEGVQSQVIWDESSGKLWNVVWLDLDLPYPTATTKTQWEYRATHDNTLTPGNSATGTPWNIGFYQPSGGICTFSSFDALAGLINDDTVRSTGLENITASGLCAIHATGYHAYKYFIRKGHLE